MRCRQSIVQQKSRMTDSQFSSGNQRRWQKYFPLLDAINLWWPNVAQRRTVVVAWFKLQPARCGRKAQAALWAESLSGHCGVCGQAAVQGGLRPFFSPSNPQIEMSKWGGVSKMNGFLHATKEAAGCMWPASEPQKMSYSKTNYFHALHSAGLN